MGEIGFIIGCARSGTTWLGKILQHNPGFRVTIEHPVIFQIVDHMALNPNAVASLMPWLISLYQEQVRASAPEMYVDKSHQNIWLVEHLIQAFKQASFIGIERSPYGTVASMLQHEGVLAHFKRWRSYPIPNRHIGLPEHLVEVYDCLPLVAKCALRWSAHHSHMLFLKQYLGPQLLVLDYEDLVLHTDQQCWRLREFLERDILPITADQATVEKWRQVLSIEQLRMIDQVIRDVDMSWLQQIAARARTSIYPSGRSKYMRSTNR